MKRILRIVPILLFATLAVADKVGMDQLDLIMNECYVLLHASSTQDNLEFWEVPYHSITLLDASCHCSGPCTDPPQLAFHHRDGTSVPFQLVSNLLCDVEPVQSTGQVFTATTNRDMMYLEGLQSDIVNTSADGDNDDITVCVRFTNIVP